MMNKPKKRSEQFGIRADKELLDAARAKAKPFGGLAAVIRAMLRMFVSGEHNFDPEDLRDERIAAPRPPDANKGGRPPKAKPKRKK